MFCTRCGTELINGKCPLCEPEMKASANTTEQQSANEQDAQNTQNTQSWQNQGQRSWQGQGAWQGQQNHNTWQGQGAWHGSYQQPQNPWNAQNNYWQYQQYNKPKATNIFAILGFVFSFISPIIGLVLSILGSKKADSEYGGEGKGLAKAGIIISALYIALIALLIVFYIVMIFVAVATGV